MVDYQFLEDAIVAIRSHRAVLGDAVVETAVTVLQEKMQMLAAAPAHQTQSAESHAQVVVLQADLSGFTAMSAEMDAEQVRDTVNALWEKLDSVAHSWGGVIDKHTGDGFIALFGVPMAQEDDAERAILAALDMQLELALFNDLSRRRIETGPLDRRKVVGEMKMRIGIHGGSVVLARVGASRKFTAVGETITTVEHVQTAAPVGGVLVSYDIYRQVYGQFEVAIPKTLTIPGRQEPLTVYVVEGAKRHHFATGGRQWRESALHFVARAAEIEKLQFALQGTMNNSVMQVITVTGEAGAGKSRLFDEFERLVAMLPVQGCILRTQAMQATQAAPYALMRDLFARLFDMNPRSSGHVGREKFVRGVESIMQAHQISAREQAHVMGHFMGFDFADSPYLENLAHDLPRLRRYAHNDLARFFVDLVNGCPPVIWLVENAQWADAASLDLIEFLLDSCADLALLAVVLARPDFWAERPSWNSPDPFNPMSTFTLPPLTAIDTRHLVAQVLDDVPNVPLRLVDLVVHGAQGNPLYVAQMGRLLFDAAIIVRQADHWQVNLSKLADMPIPKTLTELFEARVACLSAAEERVLQTAAIFASPFWDGAVQQLAAEEHGINPGQVAESLSALEQKGLIARQRSSALTGVLEYQFVHDFLWRVIYATIPPVMRRKGQERLVSWLESKTTGLQVSYFRELNAYMRLMGRGYPENIDGGHE